MYGKARLLGSNGQYSRYPLAFFLDEMRRLGLRSLDFVPQVPHFFCGYRDHDDPAGLKTALARAAPGHAFCRVQRQNFSI